LKLQIYILQFSMGLWNFELRRTACASDIDTAAASGTYSRAVSVKSSK